MEEEKFPFTAAGVEERFARIYGLDDAGLETEAKWVETDLYGWTEAGFELAASQIAYMHSLPASFAETFGPQLAFHIRHRFPVTMTKGDIAARGYKFIRPEQKTVTTYAPDQDPVVASSLNVYIS